MDSIIYLVFRSMRQPLLTLLVVYSVSVLGLVLIPGVDDQGKTWHMGFLHAFYFVSYTSTTIGFGEIPYPFTDAQRIWVTITLYTSVISWIYAIGTLLSLVQGDAFQRALTERSFARRIQRLSEPFVLISGHGSVGGELVKALTDRHQHVVVLDLNQEKIDLLALQNLRESVPSYVGDVANPENLIRAGLSHPQFTGVVAITSSNDVNLKVAITSKLMNPHLRVICRADSAEIEKNMESFGTDYIVDPFDTFAMHLSVALQSPGLHLLREWLSGASHQPLAEPVYPPQHGKWILCGFGRFGKAVYDKLTREGLDVVVIEASPEETGTPQSGCVIGKGTEADTLLEAGVENAVGIVAGTDKDVDNLSIIMTAKELNPDLFVILRQNFRQNTAIAKAVQANMTMQPSEITANRIRVLLATPMLHIFIQLAKGEEDDWACELVSRIIAIASQEVPDVWETVIDNNHAGAIMDMLGSGQDIELKDLFRNPRDRDKMLPAIPLLMYHKGERILLPSKDNKISKGDKILWCGRYSVQSNMEWTLFHPVALEYVLTGEVKPRSWVWQRLCKKRSG
jgi:Trk K+ transport system NAD-binding subunit